MGLDGQRHAPTALPPGKPRYTLNRRLGGPQGRSGRLRIISPPPGFDPRTVKPVASRYTDYAIPAHNVLGTCYNNYVKVSRRLLTAEARVQFEATDCGFCGG